MQYELIRLKNELGITFLYVTHDQEEALTMSDTIVVMNQGYIQQIGTPEDIYNEPQNAFVADFIGDSNILPATMVEDSPYGKVDGRDWPVNATGVYQGNVSVAKAVQESINTWALDATNRLMR